jgi:hypothetical protein
VQREIVSRVFAAPREGFQVVELDGADLGAPPSQAVGVGAAPFVALEDGTAKRGGDVSTAPARSGTVWLSAEARGSSLVRL